jgi:hypothetical protein
MFFAQRAVEHLVSATAIIIIIIIIIVIVVPYRSFPFPWYFSS